MAQWNRNTVPKCDERTCSNEVLVTVEKNRCDGRRIGKVVWDDETISFQVTNRLSAESYEVLGDECSVIGNVFDNPELLEE